MCLFETGIPPHKMTRNEVLVFELVIHHGELKDVSTVSNAFPHPQLVRIVENKSAKREEIFQTILSLLKLAQDAQNDYNKVETVQANIGDNPVESFLALFGAYEQMVEKKNKITAEMYRYCISNYKQLKHSSLCGVLNGRTDEFQCAGTDELKQVCKEWCALTGDEGTTSVQKLYAREGDQFWRKEA